MTEDRAIGGDFPSPVRTLKEACREIGLDDRGRKCPLCPLRDLCESEERWLVRLSSLPRA